MRIKFNHRKIVNLGKIQKYSGFGATNGFDSSSMSWSNRIFIKCRKIPKSNQIEQQKNH